MLTRLGPRPLLNERSAAELSASKHLCAALGQLGLAFTANVPLSGYWADAALQPQNDSAAPLVLATEAYDHIRNRNKRLTGRAEALLPSTAADKQQLLINRLYGRTKSGRALLSQRGQLTD
ncbi:hypothetical protein WJX82_010738 [Trebouxia sp. C0006]